MNKQAGRWLLLLCTLLFAALGQLYFSKRPNYFSDGVAFYAVAAVCFLLLTAGAGLAQAAAPQVVARRRTNEERIRLGLSIAGIVAGVSAVAALLRPHDNYWPIFWLWLAGIVLVLLAALPKPQAVWAGVVRRVRSIEPWEALAVVALIGAALMLRAWKVNTIPWTLSGDEGNFGRWARQVLSGEATNMFVTGHLSMPSLYAFFQAGWLKIAGDDVFALRLPWAIMGTLNILGVYLLVPRLFSRGLALVVTVLLTGYGYHIHYSRLALNNIADPFFMTWALYFLVVGWQGKAKWPWAVSGIVAGLAFYFYTGGRQVALLLLILLVWVAIVERGFLTTHKQNLPAMLVGFLVTVGPMALFAFRNPDEFNARFNQVGIFQSGWLDQAVQLFNKTRLEILFDQFKQTFFAYTHILDRSDFYKPARPLMDFPMAMLFLLGVVLAIVRVVTNAREQAPGSEAARPPWRYAVFVIWFFGVIVAGGVLTESAPASQRILSSSVPAVFFVGIALCELMKAFGNLLRWPRFIRYAAALIIAAVLTTGSARYYFGPYQESHIFGSFNGEVSTAIGYYMRDLGPEWKQYFMGAPRMWAEFGSATFIAKNPYLDVIEPLAGPPNFVDPGYNSAFIVLPEREGDLQWLQQSYPGGVLEAVHRVGEPNGPLLFTAYRVETKSN